MRTLALTPLMIVLAVSSARAQQSVSEIVLFLLTNRSVATDDFVRDADAALATYESLSRFLTVELGTLPIGSSAGGFAYRFDRSLGTLVLSSDNFGPLFTERSLTAGEGQTSFAVTYQHAGFDEIDGRPLRDGTLVSTATKLRSESEPFDVETLTLRVKADTVTFAGTYGVTDKLDLSMAIPIVRVSISGERFDTYRGRRFLQAGASVSASGLGDVVVRGKYNVLRTGSGGSGVALGAEVRLPTGDEENLLGASGFGVQPRLMASYETGNVAVSGNLGYAIRESSDELDYRGAVVVVGGRRLTLIGELLGRRLSLGQLTEATTPHPQLTGVDTIRLTSVESGTNRVVMVAGFKWNIANTWLLNVSVLRPLTSSGLNAGWVPAFTFDYSFGQ